MKKKGLLILISVMVLASSACIALLIMQTQKERVPPEKIPPLNSFDTADMIIALAVNGAEAYQFILSNGNELEISYGYMIDDYGYDVVCGYMFPSRDDFNNSIDFMKTVEVCRSVVVPMEDYEKMLSLGNQIIDEEPGELLVSTGDLTNIMVFRPDARYEMNYLWFLSKTYEKAEGKLVTMLEEYSPIVINYEPMRGEFTEKSLGD